MAMTGWSVAPLRRLGAYLYPYRGRYALGVLLGLLSIFFFVLSPYVLLELERVNRVVFTDPSGKVLAEARE